MKVLLARLYEQKLEEQQAKVSQQRNSLVWQSSEFINQHLDLTHYLLGCPLAWFAGWVDGWMDRLEVARGPRESERTTFRRVASRTIALA